MFDFGSARIALVGPLPPPPGGMANQTSQLARLLAREGASVEVVRTNAPYRPAFVRGLRGVRAGFRLVPYLLSLRRAARRATLVHVLANSGWAWHLFAAPALYFARRSRTPVVLNYRGGEAESFFDRSFSAVERSLRWADEVVVPSEFLRGVFDKYGVSTSIVPNIIDLDRFHPTIHDSRNGSGPHVMIARNLERIYDVATGIRAFADVHRLHPHATLSVAGTGPEAERLHALAIELGVDDSVKFLGRVDNDEMPSLYAKADIALNPSLADNMPISILEALACGVPVVSTRVGGVPALVDDDREAVLVPPGEPRAMAAAISELWSSHQKREALRRAGLDKARAFGWSRVRGQWANVYERVIEPGNQHRSR